jgi:hypothetical protein
VEDLVRLLEEKEERAIERSLDLLKLGVEDEDGGRAREEEMSLVETQIELLKLEMEKLEEIAGARAAREAAAREAAEREAAAQEAAARAAAERAAAQPECLKFW